MRVVPYAVGHLVVRSIKRFWHERGTQLVSVGDERAQSAHGARGEEYAEPTAK